MDEYKTCIALLSGLNLQFDPIELDEKDKNSNLNFITVFKLLIFTDQQELYSLEHFHFEQLQKMFIQNECFPSVFDQDPSCRAF